MGKRKILIFFLILLANLVSGQEAGTFDVDYFSPKEYEIGGIEVTGVQFVDPSIVINLTGLSVGQTIKIPGERIAKAINLLWKQGLFSDVKIIVKKVVNKSVFLEIQLKERQRLSTFSFKGVSKGESDDIKDKLHLAHGKQVTENVLNNSTNIIKDYFIDKGFLFTELKIIKKDDPNVPNHVSLTFDIDKKKRVKIHDIVFSGNKVLPSKKLKRAMKDTKTKKWYRVFKSSKYKEVDYKDDLNKVIDKYNELGYRDAKIVKDSMVVLDDKLIDLLIKVSEGKQYFFRNITWSGNTKYSSKMLTQLLGIKKGDVYNKKLLEDNLYMNERGIFSLYQDNGYLFSSINPIETSVNGDSIDLEIQIYEGKVAHVNRVTVIGNTKTNDHVILREIRTKPGELYNRSKIIRTQRELATLGYFNPEKLNVNPTPHPEDGTVDLQYVVEEKPSDQIELSGGWGAQMIVGTLGLSFNNFSLGNIFKKEAWSPLPTGDGQRLTLRAQSNGLYYQGYNFSFVEPWLGGKKPNSLTLSLYHTVFSNGINKSSEDRQTMKITGAALGFGRRLKWPDDYFSLYNEVNYQIYNLDNYSYQQLFSYNNGQSNNFSFLTAFSRNSADQPIFPRRGSNFTISLQLTPPYSLLKKNVDYTQLSEEEKYKWIEYHKWKFNGAWFTSLARKLVFESKGEFGFKGLYNRDIGPAPFEGFNVGGDGLMTYNLYGMETIALRGYENGSLTPNNGGNIYDKFTFELRYLISPNPQATLYALTFFESGNAWYNFETYNPFDVYRSAGVGIRIFLPMFGKLGVDWGYGFDEVPNRPGANKGQFHFIIGQNF